MPFPPQQHVHFPGHLVVVNEYQVKFELALCQLGQPLSSCCTHQLHAVTQACVGAREAGGNSTSGRWQLKPTARAGLWQGMLRPGPDDGSQVQQQPGRQPGAAQARGPPLRQPSSADTPMPPSGPTPHATFCLHTPACSRMAPATRSGTSAGSKATSFTPGGSRRAMRTAE